MYNKGILRIVTVLASCVLFHSLAMDIFVSCIPNMQQSLQTSVPKIQMVLSIFVIATGAGQLFIGPLVDKYGRRPLMIASALVFCVTSFMCALVSSVEQLIWLRLIQGIGACGTTVVTVSVIRDVFNEEERPKVYSYMNVAVGLAPMLAPMIGSMLLMWTGTWRSSFHFLGAFAFLGTIVAYLELEETKPSCTKMISPRLLFGYYWEVVTSRIFLSYVLCAVTALTALFIYFSLAPVLLITRLGVTEHGFSLFFGFNAILYCLGTFCCSQTVKYTSGDVSIIIGSCCAVIGASLMLYFHYTQGLSILGLVLPNSIMTFGTGFIFGPSMAGGMQPFKHITGVAAAMYGFIEYGLPGVIGGFSLSISSSNVLPLAVPMFFLGLMNLTLIASLKYSRS